MEHKIAIVGDGGVGKSALTMQFVNHQWLDTYDPTIEDSYRKQIEVDGEVCMLDILDTSGQEEFRAFRDQYLSMGQGFLMVYDMTNFGTFEHLGPLLESVRKHQEDEDIPLVIVANKCDCAPQRTVTTKDGQDFATSCNAVHIETSAKKRINVEEAFFSLVRLIRKKHCPNSVSKNKKASKEHNQPKSRTGQFLWKKKEDCILL